MKGNGMGKDVFDIFTGKRGYLTICLFSLFLSLLNLNEPRFLFSDETDELTCDFLLEKYSDYLEWFNDFSVTIESDGRGLIRDWENHTITKTNVTKFQDQWKIEKTNTINHVGRDSSIHSMNEILYSDKM